jgi:hypothetical protein
MDAGVEWGRMKGDAGDAEMLLKKVASKVQSSSALRTYQQDIGSR